MYQRIGGFIFGVLIHRGGGLLYPVVCCSMNLETFSALRFVCFIKQFTFTEIRECWKRVGDLTRYAQYARCLLILLISFIFSAINTYRCTVVPYWSYSLLSTFQESNICSFIVWFNTIRSLQTILWLNIT